MKLYETFTNNLFEILNKRGISQNAAAAAIGISKSKLSRWKTGQLYITLNDIDTICENLQISFADLFGTSSDAQTQVTITLTATERRELLTALAAIKAAHTAPTAQMGAPIPGQIRDKTTKTTTRKPNKTADK